MSAADHRAEVLRPMAGESGKETHAAASGESTQAEFGLTIDGDQVPFPGRAAAEVALDGYGPHRARLVRRTVHIWCGPWAEADAGQPVPTTFAPGGDA